MSAYMGFRGVVAASLFLGAAFGMAGEPPEGLSCDQLYSLVKSAVQYRDEGYTLAQVLAALKPVQAESKLSASEFETVRKAVTMAYLSNAWPEEIARECFEIRGQKKR